MNVEDFSLDLGGDIVPWRLFTPEGSGQEFCVLWVQGWSTPMDEHREAVEQRADKTKMVFATLDFAGHGLHRLPLEESTHKQQFEDLVAVYDELVRRGFEKIIVIGASFGGYLTALLTGKRPVHMAVLRAPANYPDDEFELPYKETPQSKLDKDANRKLRETDDRFTNTAATRAIAGYDGFVYVIEHELDEVVPAKMPKNYFNAAKHGNYIIIPKTKHSPKLMENPEVHFGYIEHFVVAIIEAARLEKKLGGRRSRATKPDIQEDSDNFDWIIGANTLGDDFLKKLG